MKAIQSPRNSSLLERFSSRSSLVVIGLLVVVLPAQRASCSPLILVSTPPPVPVAIRMGLGNIKVAVTSTTTNSHVDSATGQLRTAGEGAGAGALACLAINSGEPFVDLLGSVIAPIVAAVGAVRAHSVKVAPETLDEARQDVVNAIRELARPQLLRDSFLKAAGERTRRRFVMAESESESGNPGTDDPNGVTLTLSVEDFRLSRNSSSDKSFTLFIRTRARLFRSTDGAVLYDQPFEFRSGQCLFIDWTLNHAEPLKKVTETGYRHIADRMVQQLFLSSPGGPLVVGSGVPSPKRTPGQVPGMMLADHRAQASGRNSVRPIANLSSGGIGIYSNPSVLNVAIRSPVTRNDAMREAREDVDSDLDGLQNFPNPLVSLPAILTSIPISIYRQAVAGVRGFTVKKASLVEMALRRAEDERILHQELCRELALDLQAKTAQTVVQLPGQSRAAEDAGFIQVGLVRRTGLSNWSESRISHDFLASQGIGTVMEIQVVRAGLKGGDQVNAAQFLNVEAWVRVRRASDGLEMHAFPVQYRSGRHSFGDWAAHDARLFRRELDRCSRDFGRAVADNLVACGIVSPSPSGSQPVLAGQPAAH